MFRHKAAEMNRWLRMLHGLFHNSKSSGFENCAKSIAALQESLRIVCIYSYRLQTRTYSFVKVTERADEAGDEQHMTFVEFIASIDQLSDTFDQCCTNLFRAWEDAFPCTFLSITYEVCKLPISYPQLFRTLLRHCIISGMVYLVSISR